MLNVKTSTAKELVEFYNYNAEKPVVKFRDRATAEKRCLQLAEDIGEETKRKFKFDLEIIIEPSKFTKAVREGSKVSQVIDALWKGASESQILLILGVTRKTKANTAKFNHWLRWNVSKDKGYGIARKLEDGIEVYYVIRKDDASKVPHKKRKVI